MPLTITPVGGLSALTLIERRDAGGGDWTTRPDVELVNALCPGGKYQFPNFPWLIGGDLDGIHFDGDYRGELPRLFAKGFYRVRDTYWASQMRLQDKLGKYERKTLIAIERRTLRFGKLMEKIPSRLFSDGEIDPGTRELRMARDGFPIMEPAVPDNGALSKASRGLLTKGIITKIRSDRHSATIDASSIYSALPIDEALRLLVRNAFDAATDERVFDQRIRRRIFERIWSELQLYCTALLSEAVQPRDRGGSGAPEQRATRETATQAPPDAHATATQSEGRPIVRIRRRTRAA
jgi:hypothetical protein